MSKISIITAMTLDGFLPREDEELLKWIRSDKEGFAYWHERNTFTLPVGYSMLELICEKDDKDKFFTYTAEVSDRKGLELLHGLSIYHLIDGIVVYILPVTYGEGLSVSRQLPILYWQLHRSTAFNNGICRLFYHKVLQ